MQTDASCHISFSTIDRFGRVSSVAAFVDKKRVALRASMEFFAMLAGGIDRVLQ